MFCRYWFLGHLACQKLPESCRAQFVEANALKITTNNSRIFLDFFRSFLDKNSVNERAPCPRVYALLVAGTTNNNVSAYLNSLTLAKSFFSVLNTLHFSYEYRSLQQFYY